MLRDFFAKDFTVSRNLLEISLVHLSLTIFFSHMSDFTKVTHFSLFIYFFARKAGGGGRMMPLLSALISRRFSLVYWWRWHFVKVGGVIRCNDIFGSINVKGFQRAAAFFCLTP